MNADAKTFSEGELSAVVIRTDGRNKCPACGNVGELFEAREVVGDYVCMATDCATRFTIPIRREELGVIARSK